MNDPHIPQSTPGDGNAHHYDYEPTSPHFIEQSVQVYLRLSDDGSRWIIDGPSVDGRTRSTARSATTPHNAANAPATAPKNANAPPATRISCRYPPPQSWSPSSPTPWTNTKLQERRFAARPAPVPPSAGAPGLAPLPAGGRLSTAEIRSPSPLFSRQLAAEPNRRGPVGLNPRPAGSPVLRVASPAARLCCARAPPAAFAAQPSSLPLAGSQIRFQLFRRSLRG